MNRETDVLFLCSCRMKKKKIEEQFQKIIIARGVISIIWVTATSYAVFVVCRPLVRRRRSLIAAALLTLANNNIITK